MLTTSSRFHPAAKSLLAILFICGSEFSRAEQISEEVPEEETRLHIYNINQNPLNQVVCDPFGSPSTPTPQQGIKTDLFYRGEGQPAYYKAEDYVTHATPSTQKLFLSDIFVPTRLFTEGFATETNEVLKDDAGNKLTEFFGLKMQTTIRLSPEDQEGLYEFALLSDNGSVMKIKDGSNWVEIINNDGEHGTRLGCSSTVIDMKRDTKLEAQVLYYQGARNFMANVLVWRKLDPQNPIAGKDNKCGFENDHSWFNPNRNSEPQGNFKSLLKRGWSVVKASNFYLPEEDTYNPCTPGTIPVISNFRILELTSDSVFIAWSTDIPATSQALLIDVATGENRLTESDNVLRTNHRLRVTGLTAGTRYLIHGVSISEDLGKAMSMPSTEFTTP